MDYKGEAISTKQICKDGCYIVDGVKQDVKSESMFKLWSERELKRLSFGDFKINKSLERVIVVDDVVSYLLKLKENGTDINKVGVFNEFCLDSLGYFDKGKLSPYETLYYCTNLYEIVKRSGFHRKVKKNDFYKQAPFLEATLTVFKDSKFQLLSQPFSIKTVSVAYPYDLSQSDVDMSTFDMYRGLLRKDMIWVLLLFHRLNCDTLLLSSFGSNHSLSSIEWGNALSFCSDGLKNATFLFEDPDREDFKWYKHRFR